MQPSHPHPGIDVVPGVAIDEHLTIVRAGGDLRTRLISTLTEAGWRLLHDADLPAPDPAMLEVASPDRVAEELDAARQVAAAADRDLLEVLSDLDLVNVAIERSDRRAAELEGLSDLLAAELAEPRHRDDSTERLTRIAEGASGLGFDRFAPEVTAWIRKIADGSAPADPIALDLMARRAELDQELAQGTGSAELAPEVLLAHARRHELRSLIVELELMAERGLTAENRALIEDAHHQRVATEEQTGRRGTAAARDALAAEEAALARFGFASYPDFQISTSTRSVGEHAETTLVSVRQELEEADAALERAVESTRSVRARLESDRLAVTVAMEERAGSRSIEGIVATPEAISELHDSVHEAREAELIEGGQHRDRSIELHGRVAERTQAAAAAEAAIEAALGAQEAAADASRGADLEIERAEVELADTLALMLLGHPLVIEADLAWVASDRLVALLDHAALTRPIVLCTGRDLAPGRAIEGPRWWQFRRRARQSALSA